MDLKQALAAHVEWKIKFRTALANKESLDAATIARDDCCALGKWLHGESRAKFGKLPSHVLCVARHAEFHTAAAGLARLINGGNYAEAEAMLAPNTPYSRASAAVASAIMQLTHDVGQ